MRNHGCNTLVSTFYFIKSVREEQMTLKVCHCKGVHNTYQSRNIKNNTTNICKTIFTVVFTRIIWVTYLFYTKILIVQSNH